MGGNQWTVGSRSPVVLLWSALVRPVLKSRARKTLVRSRARFWTDGTDYWDACMRPVAYGPHWPRLPPPVSPAPTSHACPHRPRLPPWRGGGFGTGTRHWAPALAVGIGFSFSLFHISVHSFPSLWIDRQLSFFILSLLLSTNIYFPVVIIFCLLLVPMYLFHVKWPTHRGGMMYCLLWLHGSHVSDLQKASVTLL